MSLMTPTRSRRATGLTPIRACSASLPAARHSGWSAEYANYAPRTMHAHRLWIKLWISLGQPEENCGQLVGNGAVAASHVRTAHSAADGRSRVGHSRCARPDAVLAGRTRVIPGIHRPYDDYQFCYGREIPTQVGQDRSATPALRVRPDKEGDR